jgi:hypothetical protein
VDKGKLYRPGNEKAVISIDYRLHVDSAAGWRGEFVLKEYIRLIDGDDYMIEFEDGRKGVCSIRKKVNKAMSVGPPRYNYSFKGLGKLK